MGLPGLIPARAGSTIRTSSSRTRSRAHPRSRGEHSVVCKSPWTSKGSSPLARGTLLDWFNGTLVPVAHPRSRGEHVNHSYRMMTALGSSPLARGTPIEKVSKCPNDGLIPARAGNTLVPSSLSQVRKAHPRSRGEHFILSARLLWRMGSSPLARGTRNGRHEIGNGQGLIPARAGNTVRSTLGMNAKRAHPRSRGEHALCRPSVRSR